MWLAAGYSGNYVMVRNSFFSFQ